MRDADFLSLGDELKKLAKARQCECGVGGACGCEMAHVTDEKFSWTNSNFREDWFSVEVVYGPAAAEWLWRKLTPGDTVANLWLLSRATHVPGWDHCNVKPQSR